MMSDTRYMTLYINQCADGADLLTSHFCKQHVMRLGGRNNQIGVEILHFCKWNGLWKQSR
jgi:hypothetical protein